MPDVPEKPNSAVRTWQIARLVKETGITEAEATDLVTVLGTDWGPLVREAHILTQKR